MESLLTIQARFLRKNLAAEDSSDSESNALENQTKNYKNIKLRHVIKQQFEFHY